MFSVLGFAAGPGSATKTALSLFPPNVSPFTDEGKANRERLLRAWVELQAYLIDYQRRFRESCFAIVSNHADDLQFQHRMLKIMYRVVSL